MNATIVPLDPASIDLDFIGKMISDSLNDLEMHHEDCDHHCPDAIRELCEKDLPIPTKLISNDPATVLFFDGEDKVVSKCQEGDTFNARRGIINCVVRRLTKNRGHAVNELEKNIEVIASLESVAELDDYIKFSEFMTDVLKVYRGALELPGAEDVFAKHEVKLWHGDIVPKIDNYPAYQWRTDAERNAHIGDNFILRNEFVSEGPKAYVFMRIDGEYQWVMGE